jgi:CHAD domain-containing protein
MDRRPALDRTAVKQILEREVKLDIGPGFRLPRLPGRPIAPHVFVSIYYDTPDHRLAREGVTVRCRTTARRRRWHVKLPRGAARLEIELPGSSARLPDDVERLLTAYTRTAPLTPIATLRTRRSGILVRERGRPVAEVTLDSVAVLDGRRVKRRFREVEVELVGDGDEEILRRIVGVLRARGATESDGRPKVFRALGLDVSPRGGPAAEPTTPIEHVMSAMRAQLDAIRAHDPGTRLGAEPEELHQMRVAARRLRAILRAARPMLGASRVEPLREELAWLGTALGGRRDLDVLRDHLRDEVAALEPADRRVGLGLLRRLERARTRARVDFLAALDSPRYLELLDRVEDFLASPADVGTETSLSDLGARAFRKLRRTVEALPGTPTDEDLHTVRVKAKRARYAAELATVEVGRPAERLAGRLKKLQDILGAHQDAAVAEARLRELAGEGSGPGAGLVAGLLVERERARRMAARAAFEEWWPKVRRRGRKAWR